MCGARHLLLALLLFESVASCTASAVPPDGGLSRIRGGFPVNPDRRVGHAVQLRLADSALRAVESAGPNLLGSILRDGLSIPRAPSKRCRRAG